MYVPAQLGSWAAGCWQGAADVVTHKKIRSGYEPVVAILLQRPTRPSRRNRTPHPARHPAVTLSVGAADDPLIGIMRLFVAGAEWRRSPRDVALVNRLVGVALRSERRVSHVLSGRDRRRSESRVRAAWRQ